MATKTELEQELKEKDKAFKDLEKQMQQMQKMMEQMMNQKTTNNIVVEKEETILPSKKIKVISLISNSLNLSTEEDGRGKKFNFPSYGYVHNIRFEDLEGIVHADRRFLECFYICDKEAVIQLGLEDEYEKMADKKGMDSITNLESIESVEMFKNLDKTLQDSAITMILEKMNQGQFYDENNVYALNMYLNKNLREMAQDLKNLVPKK